MPKSLDEFWKVNLHYAKQLEVLRSIILDCGLGETFKWAFPTYTLGKKKRGCSRLFQRALRYLVFSRCVP